MAKRIRGAMFWRSALASASLIAMNHALAAQDNAAERPLLGTGERVSLIPATSDVARLPADSSKVRVRVSIASGALEPALKALEEQVSLRLAYETSLTENLSTRGVEGEFRPLEALAALLDGTGLTYRMAGSSTITLVNPRYVQLGSDSASSVVLDELSVEGTTRANAGTNQDGSATSGGGPSGIVGYTARISPSATKTNTPSLRRPSRSP
ncbi:STN domain-containing protein [Methylorubrum salsuginis]|uniref:Secretin and TonB N terminus short domain n=1 Tax=Methylorubrum salsuginis TaxID=414703 RepID=A0A1I4MKD8_9HYPH|nr:Secretin and TonB N terminus short domain [Methylorubrum salsuginis]